MSTSPSTPSPPSPALLPPWSASSPRVSETVSDSKCIGSWVKLTAWLRKDDTLVDLERRREGEENYLLKGRKVGVGALLLQ